VLATCWVTTFRALGNADANANTTLTMPVIVGMSTGSCAGERFGGTVPASTAGVRPARSGSGGVGIAFVGFDRSRRGELLADFGKGLEWERYSGRAGRYPDRSGRV
jgi:hypothetical protein